ncbi:trypsin-like serine peptidase [Streptomyces parvulus]|uniref:trypsin-like serine peptidase n=1 Tax=Streptomyces parvulus TaxID=146923 RepID=UPI003EBB3856
MQTFEINTFSKNILFTTVRIHCEGPQGGSDGTAFIYAIDDDMKRMTPVLVTNKHVIAGAKECTIHFVQGQKNMPALSEDAIAYRFPSRPEGPWVGHPSTDVDVAVMPLGPCLNEMEKVGVSPFVRVIPPNAAPRPDDLDAIDASANVIFVGYPNGLYDAVNKTPILRRGITASPIHLDWQGQPQFLIDASVFPGSSGSPVFLEPNPFANGGISVGGPESAPQFVGVVAAVYQRKVNGEIVFTGKAPRVEVFDPINLGIVYKWTAIEQTIDAMCAKLGIERKQLNSAPEPWAQIVKEPTI